MSDTDFATECGALPPDILGWFGSGAVKYGAAWAPRGRSFRWLAEDAPDRSQAQLQHAERDMPGRRL